MFRRSILIPNTSGSVDDHPDSDTRGRVFLGHPGPHLPAARCGIDPGRLYRRPKRAPDLPQPSRSRRGDRDELRPSKTDYRALLEFFFQIHDPTTKNRQGNDVGTSYRSAIFYLDDDQQRIARDTIADVDASGLWPATVVTEVTPASDFWEAEPEHQDYLQRYPGGYTCHYVRPEWKLCSGSGSGGTKRTTVESSRDE